MQQLTAQYEQGLVSIEDVNNVLLEFTDAELAVESDAESRVKALLAMVERFKDVEARSKARLDVGDGNFSDFARSQAMLIRGEIWLVEERIRQQGGKKDPLP